MNVVMAQTASEVGQLAGRAGFEWDFDFAYRSPSLRFGPETKNRTPADDAGERPFSLGMLLYL